MLEIVEMIDKLQEEAEEMSKDPTLEMPIKLAAFDTQIALVKLDIAFCESKIKE